MSRYHRAYRMVAFAQVREIIRPLKDELNPDFSFGDGEGFFFKWDSGKLTVWNAHPNWMDLDEGERKEVGSEIFGAGGISGAVDHGTRVVAIDPNLNSTRWSGKLTGNIKLIQSIIRSLRKYDSKIGDDYSVRFQSGFSRDLGNRDMPDADTVGEIMSVKPVQRGEKGRSVTLYHGTNSALLADILEHGLRPSRETGSKNWGGTEFRHNVNAVYLASDRERAEYYAQHSAAEQHALGRLDAEPAVLRVTVPTDGLLADDDWLRKEFRGDKEKARANVSNWHDSLTKFGQVAFLGRVPPSAVEVLQGSPTEKVEHEFGDFATGSPLSYALDDILGSENVDHELVYKLSSVILRLRGDLYWMDELDALGVSPHDPSLLIAAVDVVEDYAWEVDEEYVHENAISTIRDIEWSNENEGHDDEVPDEDELIAEMMEDERAKKQKERAAFAKELQAVLNKHRSQIH